MFVRIGITAKLIGDYLKRYLTFPLEQSVKALFRRFLENGVFFVSQIKKKRR
ncbi:MAG: hypothetical protein ACFFBD_01150 [Candidatus Hodarchaeota archaeon]